VHDEITLAHDEAEACEACVCTWTDRDEREQ
jgi:hypothetical protein